MSSQRRIWLRAMGAISLATAAERAAPHEAAAAPSFAFLRSAEVQFLAAAADRMIPEDEYPSASQAGVMTYIDRQLAGPFGLGQRLYLEGPLVNGTPEQGYQLGLPPAAVYRESLDALLSEPAGRRFAALAPPQQDVFLGELESGAWMLGSVPSSIFFETLLANVIEGYFSDPVYGGNRDMVGWRMIGFPGAYAHFTQWVGRHNVRFDRPPVGMASSSSAHGHGHPHDHMKPAPQGAVTPPPAHAVRNLPGAR